MDEIIQFIVALVKLQHVVNEAIEALISMILDKHGRLVRRAR